MTLYDKIIRKEAAVSLIGLGYVGLPIALEFAKKARVVGFDIRPDRIDLMKQGTDPSKELSAEAFEDVDILFTANPEDLKEAHFHIVAVPTPIDEFNIPNLKPILSACHTLGKVLKKGDYVVFESTVYPGCTEEDCIPILEKESGLKYKVEFKVGYSPERINPGDKVHTLANIVKVAAGCDEESTDVIAKTYELVVKAGVFRAASIKVAEAAKIIENTQRDVNIALMNELSIIFGRMQINTYDVLEAAGTKWNFLKFFPGLVGGHCIGVDPYYLSHKAKQLGYHPQIINSGRYVNDSMGGYVAKQTVKKLIANDVPLKGAKVLVMGITFKENVADIRNSKVIDVIRELQSYMVDVDLVDPHANAAEVKDEYGIEMCPEITSGYEAVILAVNHQEYMELDEAYFASISKTNGVLIDVKGMLKGRVNKMNYWSL